MSVTVKEKTEIDDKKKATMSVKKKRSFRRRPRKREDSYNTYAEQMRKHLSERFGTKRTRKINNAQETVAAMDADGCSKIVNSEKYNACMQKAEVNLLNKLYQIEAPERYLNCAWKCSLCQQRTDRSELGDLFGPYFVTLNSRSHWPSFLLKKSAHPESENTIDVWFHGDCALWTPDIELHGNKIPNLSDIMQKVWLQKCAVCKKEGASIDFGDRTYGHYPCAVGKGYEMDRLHLLARPRRA
ncbi:hypothetical protein AB6A40_002993 [Gnathostoma spinigerum]|uniref:PHD-type domain-containing protein n=1 Tax=Gnathostoma spinigerum TaxID=75299 RepID=A0ABD6EDQ5_9BILA